jgi:AcrR family transcriptional regulator
MTDKKENILAAALDLFANEGYHAVSTSKIAKRAKVSEGLIFRHFGNKKGLLEAIMKDAEQKVAQILAPILFEDDPKEVIRKVIQTPFNLIPENYGFWKLQYKLKWETEYNHPHKMKPLIDKMQWAFAKLGAEEPEQEAILLHNIIDMVGIRLMRREWDKDSSFQAFLMRKYKV